MDEKLLKRVQAAGALLVAVAYFLPWASIMSPFGTIQLRGLYVDYAWVLLILAILSLLILFATPNKEALGLSDSWIKYIQAFYYILPFAVLAFLTLYGSSFPFHSRCVATGKFANLFGNEFDAVMKAGLDYGYWIGVVGAV